MHEVKIPKMGQSTVDVDLTAWHVQRGDRVQQGQPLAEVESEKVTLEIEADLAGVVDEILIEAGAVTEVGAVICRIRPD